MSLTKNAIYNALLTGSKIILPFITFPYASRVLTPQGVGEVNFANSLIQYFILIASLGIPLYGTRELSKIRDNVLERSKLLFELIFIRILTVGLASIVYLILLYFNETLTEYRSFFLWGILTILLSIADVNFFFSAMEDFKFIAKRTFLLNCLLVIFIFSLVKERTDTLLYFVLPSLILVLNTFINITYLKRYLDLRAIRLNLRFRIHLKPLIFLFATVFFSSVYNLLNTTFLGFFSDMSSVGYYSSAIKIIGMPLTFLTVLVPVLIPRISYELAKSNFERATKLISQSLDFVLLIGVPIVFGLICIAPEVVRLILGGDYLPSILVLRIVSPGILLIAITMSFSNQILIPARKDKEVLIAVIAGTAACIILNILLMPSLGHIGAAFSFIVAETLVLVICYVHVLRSFNFKFPTRSLLLNSFFCFPFLLFAEVSRYTFVSPAAIVISTMISSATFYLIIQSFVLKSPTLNILKDKLIKQWLPQN